jgi:hypothetical protein
MAAVSVFVDDAIRGDLPLVCAKTGEPADLIIRMRQPVGGMPPVVWLLLLLGPVGFVGVLVLALSWPNEHLTVRIPETEASYQRERQMERLRLGALGAGVFVPILGILAAAVHVMLWRQAIEVSIDVTRRWVTFRNVHPDFVDAVQRQEASPRR